MCPHGFLLTDFCQDIREAVDYGVIKMNIDTDTQWSYWNGIRDFEAKYRDYLQKLGPFSKFARLNRLRMVEDDEGAIFVGHQWENWVKTSWKSETNMSPISKWLGTHHLALEILRDSWRRIGMTGVMNRYEYCANSFGNSNSHIDTIATIVSGSCWQQAARRMWTYTSQSLVLMLQVETYLSRSYIFFCHMLGILWCVFGTAVLLMLDTLKLWDDDPGAPMAPFCSGRRLATRMARTSPTRSTTTPAPASAPRRIPQWNAWSSASRIFDVWTFWGWDLLTHGGRLGWKDQTFGGVRRYSFPIHSGLSPVIRHEH